MKGKPPDTTLFRALSDPTRLRIVSILLEGERCACELPSLVRKAQPTVSLQLKKLHESGVVSFRKDGTKCIYSIADKRVGKMLEMVR